MNKVINFHELTDSIWFEKVVVYLKSRYTMITPQELSEYYYNRAPLKNACLLTVDDGHSTSYDVIYPILKKHNVPAIFFVSPQITKREREVNFWFQEIREYDKSVLTKLFSDLYGIATPKTEECVETMKKMSVDVIWKMIFAYMEQFGLDAKTPQNMTVEQVRKIDKESLVTIGAHTLTHPILANETDERSMKEIQESVVQLEDLLQHPVITFAYPNGRPAIDFGEREMQFLENTSVKLAFSTQPHNFSRQDNALAIPRYGLSCGYMNIVKLKLMLGKYYPLIKNILK